MVAGFAFTPGRDRPVGLFVSKQATVVAQDRSRNEQSVVELPSDAIASGAIDAGDDSFWVAARMCRVSLSDRDGQVTALDLTAVDPLAARQVLVEAGIPVSVEAPSTDSSRSSAGQQRLWLLKALLVGVLLTFGGASVLLAIPASQDDGLGSGV